TSPTALACRLPGTYNTINTTTMPPPRGAHAPSQLTPSRTTPPAHCSDNHTCIRPPHSSRASGASMALRVAAAAAVCLAAATCPTAEGSCALAPSATQSSAHSVRGGGGSDGGSGSGSPEKRFQRRGLAKHATRGCFVLCVTPSSLAGNGSDAARRRRAAGFQCRGLPEGA
ncbi:unnamed protein product, partial [Laminaria digitata]